MIYVKNGVPSQKVEEAVLFPFDDSSIPLTYCLQLGLVQGRRQGIVVRPSEPRKPDCNRVRYYGTVIRIGDEFRMWYLGDDKVENLRVCYAVSKDGVHWEKPNLGLVEYNGSTQNNLVDLLEGKYSVAEAPIIYDPEDPDPARRFKMAFESEKYHFYLLGVAFSPDGLHWKESPNNPVTKYFLEPSGLIKFNECYYVNGQGGHPRPGAPRQMVTYMSYDFEHWTESTALSFRRDLAPLPRFSGNAGEQVHLGASLWNRGNVIIGFYGMWHGHETNDRRLVTMDLGLVVSHDAVHFREPIPDFKIVPCYEEPETEPICIELAGMCALAQGQGFENFGDQTMFWYEVWGQGKVRLATWPRDRFGYYEVYRDGMKQLTGEPHFISCPITLNDSGCRVFVNVTGLSANSHIKVEVCDEQFRGLLGYSGDDCIPITESGFRQPVVWRSKEVLEKFGHPIRIKVNFGGIRPEDIRVYAVYISSSAKIASGVYLTDASLCSLSSGL